jgi:two-component system, OmpR family, phosphate regulon sensor histidine kinase PhoR
MNKKIITGLIILMGLSIIGIIIVQLVWMDNAIKLRNEQFDRSASEAMHQTVSRLENMHDIMVINHLAFPDTSLRKRRMSSLPSPRWVTGIRAPRIITERNVSQVVRKGNQEKIEVEIKTDSGKVITYDVRGIPDRSSHDLKEHASGQQVIVFSGDSLKYYDTLFSRGMIALDSLTVGIDSVEKNPADLRRIHIRATSLRNTAERAVTEIKMLDDTRIDQKELEQILTEELNNRNIPIPFQYGIIRDSTFLMCSEKPDSVALLSAPFRTELYPNNIFRRNILLSLYFPARDQYIFTSIGWLLGASFLFSMIILIAFSFSVFIILKQKKISEMKAEFINNMTHEFKTPIATISVATDSILNEKVISDRDKVEYFAAMIKKENQRMNQQVEDILTIARLEKKELDFKWEMVDIHELISEVCDVIRIQVEQRGGKILTVLDSRKPVIRADRQHLSNAVFNLLDNANKYSPVTPEITVRITGKDQGLLLTVADKGTGMSKQVQSKIFERFYRQPSGNVHNVKGFGLGLSYVKAIVEAHRGTISVHSELGKGSTFTLLLPYNHISASLNEKTE